MIIKENITSTIKNKYVKDSLSDIKLTDYQPNHLTYKVKNNTPQFAVFSEMFYPKGWKALIDGVPAPIINVNYVLRGLHIPKNSSQIEFIFKPGVVDKGTILRVTSLLIFILTAIILGYFKYFKKTT